MPLLRGSRLGAYEVLAALGAGGMGEVYRARDTKLGREVAIKVVLESMVADPERAARFRREAQVLASLNHPNIATLHGMEEADGQHFLVMELVDGEDLSQRLLRGAIPLDDALPIARQIADALEVAHDAGIIHRDLKPANIKVKADGTVKVLDFGLAKAMGPPSPEATAGKPASGDAANSPTLTAHATQMGMIIGTAAYMSPEQARGRAVDKRADIWAFGVVLYEMLTGRRAFEGDDISITLANVLKDDVSWQTLPPDLPAPMRRVLRRCLEKDPRRRLSAISDARLELDDAGARVDRDGVGATDQQTAPPIASWRRALPYVIGCLGLVVGSVGVALWMTASPDTSPSLPVSRFVIPLPPDAPFVVHSSPGRSIAISSDGTQIAYATSDGMADSRIRLRRLDATEIRSIPGTEKARAPFFSRDGQWLAFFDWSEKALKKVSVSQGVPVTLQRGLANAGWTLGSWCDDGRIVFDTWNGGLRVVDADGQSQRVLTKPADAWHLDPQALPGACRVLYFTYRPEGQAIEAISADGGAPTRVLENASHGRFIESGHLLFIRDGALHIAPFDAERLTVIGAAVPVPINAVMDWFNVSTPSPQLAVSRNGTLVYAPDDDVAGSPPPIVAVTRDGQPEQLGVSPFFYPAMSLAPNGEDLALSGRRAGRARIETFNLRQKGITPLIDLGAVDMPSQGVWTLDGKAILYSRYGPFEGEIVRHELSGSMPDRVVGRVPGTWICPWSISQDGRWLVVTRYALETQGDVLLIDLQAAPTTASAKHFAASADDETFAAISPNGEWVAYSVDRGDGRELIIEKFPEGGQKTRVGPVAAPGVWAPDRNEIYFTASSSNGSVLDMMSARVDFTPRLTVHSPRRLFSGSYMSGKDMGHSFTITRDGKRFLMIKNPPGVPPSQGTAFASRLMVVQNWFAELRRGL